MVFSAVLLLAALRSSTDMMPAPPPPRAFGRRQGAALPLDEVEVSWKHWSGHACHGNEAKCGKEIWHLCDFMLITLDECKQLCLQDPLCDGVGVRTAERPPGMIEPPSFCRLHKNTPGKDPWMISGWDCHVLSGKPPVGAVDLSSVVPQKLAQLKALHENAPLVLPTEKYEQAKQRLAALQQQPS